MVPLLVLHLMQVVIDGAYKAPREVNYWFGLGAARAHARAVAHGLSAAVGSKRLLGDEGRDESAGQRAM